MNEPLRRISERPRLVITTINRKGGPGKSNITANLTAELVLRGYNVGLIDTDSQEGNVSFYLGLPREDGLYNALVGVEHGGYYYPMELADVVRAVPEESYKTYPALINEYDELVLLRKGEYPAGKFLIIPSGSLSYSIPLKTDDIDCVHDLCQRFLDEHDLDFVFVDTSPTVTLLDGAIYRAADTFLCVTEPEVGSMIGLTDAFKQVSRQARARYDSDDPFPLLLGVIPNKFRSTKDHVDGLKELQENFGELAWPLVRQLKTYSKSNRYGQTVRTLSPRGGEAREITTIVDRFEEVVMQRLKAAAR